MNHDDRGAADPERRRPMAVVAHRGSTDPARGVMENTLAAFRAAVDGHADGIELDVRRSADGAAVVHHDAAVPGVGLVHELAVRELPAHVPLLEDVFEVVAPGSGLTVHVEIKNLPADPGFDPDDQLAREVARVVAEADAGDEVVVSSFWPPALDALRREDAEVRLALLCPSWMDPGSMVEAAVARGAAGLHPPIGVTGPELVRAAHAAGLEVAVWTAQTPADVRHADDCGADAVMVDDVAMALRVLGRQFGG